MGGEGFFELEFFEVAVGLVDGELVNVAVGFFASGDFDGFFELGAGRLNKARATRPTRRRNRDSSSV